MVKLPQFFGIFPGRELHHKIGSLFRDRLAFHSESLKQTIDAVEGKGRLIRECSNQPIKIDNKIGITRENK